VKVRSYDRNGDYRVLVNLGNTDHVLNIPEAYELKHKLDAILEDLEDRMRERSKG
jgi:hypothetical protein